MATSKFGSMLLQMPVTVIKTDEQVAMVFAALLCMGTRVPD
jgi:hypothetical protein